MIGLKFAAIDALQASRQGQSMVVFFINIGDNKEEVLVPKYLADWRPQ
jgi:hypothetical protein